MRILYLHRTQAKGVEGVHIGEIVNAWRHLGHDVKILSPVGDQLVGDVDVSGVAAASIKHRFQRFLSGYLPEFLFELVELAYNFATVRQAKRVGAEATDFIFERYAIFAVAGAYLAKRWSRPFIVEVNYTSCTPLVRERSRILKPLAKRADRYIFSRATALVAVSSYLKQHLITEFGVQPERIFVVPNAADPDVFDISKVSRPATLADIEGKIIGFVGGFYPWHGLELLLLAFRQIAHQVPSAKLMLVGDGPTLSAIRAQIDQLGLEERVILPGKIAHKDLPGYIAMFHCGVMPDSNAYGSPMKIFEYMALGKPVIVPNYGPLLDVIDDGVEGRVFAARSVDQLADCMALLLTDADAHARMGVQARQKIVTKHNWRKNAEAILAILSGSKE